MSFRHSKLATVTDKFPAGTTAADMLRLSETNWTPQVLPVEAAWADCRNIRVLANPSNRRALQAVTSDYSVNSHVRHVEALQPLIADGTIAPERVCSWRDGAVLAFQFRLLNLQDVHVTDGDSVRMFLTMLFRHGTGRDSVSITSFRLACSNQFGRIAALDVGNRVTHRGNVEERYDEVIRRSLTEHNSDVYGRVGTMRAMVGKRMKGDEFLRFFAESFGTKGDDTTGTVLELKAYGEAVAKAASSGTNPASVREPTGIAGKVVDVVRVMRNDHTVAHEHKGTLWAGYNAVTSYLTHTAGKDEFNRQEAAIAGDVIDVAWSAATRAVAR
jgi:hypothetical protein